MMRISGQEVMIVAKKFSAGRRIGLGAVMLHAAAPIALNHAMAQTASPDAESAVVDPDEQRCMALSMYWEARGEGEEGMIAVGSVVLNRMAHEEFPDSVCEVVYDGGETPPCQFSWWCDGRSDMPLETEPWELALQLAATLLTDAPDDPTNGALFFHNVEIEMPWRIDRTRTATISRHIYYR